jgi:hypothetical protein
MGGRSFALIALLEFGSIAVLSGRFATQSVAENPKIPSALQDVKPQFAGFLFSMFENSTLVGGGKFVIFRTSGVLGRPCLNHESVALAQRSRIRVD